MAELEADKEIRAKKIAELEADKEISAKKIAELEGDKEISAKKIAEIEKQLNCLQKENLLEKNQSKSQKQKLEKKHITILK